MPFDPQEEILRIPGEFRVALTVGGTFVVGLPTVFLVSLAMKLAPKFSMAWANLNSTLAIATLCISALLIITGKIVWRLAYINHLKTRTRVLVACRISTITALAFVGLSLAALSVFCLTFFNQPLVSSLALLTAPASLLLVPSKSKWQILILNHKSA